MNDITKLTRLFKNDDGEPFELSKTQKEIFNAIVYKKHSRVGVICPTQYGKSMATALGIIIRATTMPESWTIIGGTQAKAFIIMRYINQHIFDSKELFASQLELTGEKLEQLRRERRRDHLTFKRGGAIRILSAEFRNKKALGTALIGEGGQNIIIDDSVLCDDDQYAFIKRMVGGRKNTFILELANPLKRNHFYKTMTTNKLYYKIWIDWEVAMREGRLQKSYIDEMRKEKFFDMFYECKFPDANQIDDRGYMRLLTDAEVEGAVSICDFIGEKFGGVDLGRGGNKNTICLRSDNFAKIVRADRVADTTQITGGVILTAKDFDVPMRNISIDDGGLAGTSDRLKEQSYPVNGVKFGSKSDADDFANKRAEMYWHLREWVKRGGRIDNNEDLINQLKEIRFKSNSSGKVILESKEDMLARGVESPDEADAFALTFAIADKIDVRELRVSMEKEMAEIPDTMTVYQEW